MGWVSSVRGTVVSLGVLHLCEWGHFCFRKNLYVGKNLHPLCTPQTMASGERKFQPWLSPRLSDHNFGRFMGERFVRRLTIIPALPSKVPSANLRPSLLQIFSIGMFHCSWKSRSSSSVISLWSTWSNLDLVLRETCSVIIWVLSVSTIEGFCDAVFQTKPTMDNLHYWLIFDPGKSRQKTKFPERTFQK